MSSTKPQICCSNLSCVAPLNSFGSLVCEACQTPLVYRYLWATGRSVEQIPAGTQIAGRYYVMATQIWLDTQPSLPPDVPQDWPDQILPYLYLYPERLHVPEVYGFCPAEGEIAADSIALLANAPLDAEGNLYPAIVQAWPQATAVRQVYWLWQLLQLWTSLAEQGVAASLLAAQNIRVEGWRVRLCQLYQDVEVLPAPEEETDPSALTLADLANVWLGWIENAQPAIGEPLKAICQQMQIEGAELSLIASQLNALLLEHAAQLPLRLQVVGGTDTGPERSHNEDACYPLTLGQKSPADSLMPRLALVCDGIGGHEGGEVASQMAVQTLKLQVQALLAEVAEQSEPVPPDLLAQQLEASIRVVNNLIAAQNDAQGREDRRRMGTTLVMAVQVPQRVRTSEAMLENGHELYLVHVGDSRVYWITQQYCQQLTVDDDVATREVRMGRSLHWEAMRRPDAGALTQALGTRDAEFLHPTVQRFILEEDGILLLCSDGLSDNGLVEQTWMTYAGAVLQGQRSLESAASGWIELANQKNGYDNTSVVLLRCQVSSAAPDVSLPKLNGTAWDPAEWSPASQALLENETATAPSQEETAVGSRQSRKRMLLLGLLLLFGLGLGIGVFVLAQLNPSGFQQLRERSVPSSPSSNPSPPKP